MSQNEDVVDGKKESDKKSVKNILSQLLPSVPTLTSISVCIQKPLYIKILLLFNHFQPPFGTQEHYTLPLGVSLPVIVYENEPSSIIAYTLNSVEYKKAFEELTVKKNVEQTPSPVTKRKSNSDKEKNEDEKSINLLGFLRNKDSKSDLNNTLPNSTNSDSR